MIIKPLLLVVLGLLQAQQVLWVLYQHLGLQALARRV